MCIERNRHILFCGWAKKLYLRLVGKCSGMQLVLPNPTTLAIPATAGLVHSHLTQRKATVSAYGAPGLSQGEIAEAMDRFFERPENRLISVVQALAFVAGRARGVSESVIEEFAAAARGKSRRSLPNELAPSKRRRERAAERSKTKSARPHILRGRRHAARPPRRRKRRAVVGCRGVASAAGAPPTTAPPCAASAVLCRNT